jgi:hypothetical protein
MMAVGLPYKPAGGVYKPPQGALLKRQGIELIHSTAQWQSLKSVIANPSIKLPSL